MTNTDFRASLEPWMATGAKQLIATLPSGSGIFRVIDIPAAQYQTGYVSSSAGSFKALGESGNWYGTNIKTCFAEVNPAGNPVYEVTKFREDVPFLDMFILPRKIVQAIYEDRHLPIDSYSKSQIVIELANNYLPTGCYSGVYFPSRREDGGVLTYDPHRIPVEFTYTGIRPPPPELYR